MKRNGFSLPLHRLQLLSWCVVTILSSLFYSVVGINLSMISEIIILSVYTIGFLSSLFFGFGCTLSDPTDEAVKVRYESKNYGCDFNVSQLPRLCSKCGSNVGAKSKHCNKCNRCTAQFDHHCDWLNNCIGGTNYNLFLLLLFSLETWVTLQLSVSLYFLFLIFNGEDTGQSLILKYDVHDEGYLYIVMLLCTSILCVLIASGTGYMMLFHAWLRIKGISTYEFIVSHRKTKIQVDQLPEVEAIVQRNIDTSGVVVERNLPIIQESVLEPNLDLKLPQEATPSVLSEFELKKMFSRTLDDSSLPSFQDKPTDFDFGTNIRRRKAREDVMNPAEESSANEESFGEDAEVLPQKHCTSPLPLHATLV